jgi:hypothetical protein
MTPTAESPMRPYAAALALSAAVFSSSLVEAQAQPETLFSGVSRVSGWGGPLVRVGDFAGKTAGFVGGRGGVQLGGSFTIAGMGAGLVNDNIREPGASGRQLTMGYGGLYLEQMIAPNRLVHLSVGTLLGAGGASWIDRLDRRMQTPTDGFFVVEPEIALEVNVTRFFRIGVTGSYRSISGLGLPGLAADQLSGPTGGLSFKFGKF